MPDATVPSSTPTVDTAPQPAPPYPTPVTPPVAASSTTTAAPPEPEHHSYHLQVGPEIGVFFPTSSKLRNAFGSTWFSVGLGLGSVTQPTTKGAVGLDLNVIGRTGSNTHAYIIPIGLQYWKALSSSTSSIPYAGISADAVLADIRYPNDGAHSGLRSTGGGSVFLGTTLTRNAYIEARYIFSGDVQGFNLSGLNLTAGFRF